MIHFESHHTFSATLKVLNDIITTIDKRQYCAALFIDLAKAFDSFNHHILIGRLNSLGFSNDCLAWFSNCFSVRVQCVKSEGLLCGPLAVSIGMPQGSILGPTLFSVYINDVDLAAGDSLIHLYADDTILYTSSSSLDTVLTNFQTRFIAIRFVTQDPYTTHHCDLFALVGWPSLHIRRESLWLHVIYKSMLGKAPPYLSSLATITTPTHSMRSSRYISRVIPKANTSFGRISFQFSAANDWNELQKSLTLETYISLTNFKHQLSEQLTNRCSSTQPICK